MRIEVLYFDGCPSHEALLPRLRELMEQTALEVPVELKHVGSVEQAERERFLGSPTLRIDGRDVDPAAAERNDYGLKCRLYAHADGLRGAVPDELITGALNGATARAELDASARVLRDTFPAADDAPLALALLRLLAHGRPVEIAALARQSGRDQAAARALVEAWPNVELAGGAVTGFAGLTLRPTRHHFNIGGPELHTWCAWDTLFLPALLGTTANVRSTCAVTHAPVELTVTREAIVSAAPNELRISFPPAQATDPSAMTSSFCRHVHFLAGPAAAASWEAANPGGRTLDIAAAFALGQQAVAPLLGAPVRPAASA